MPKEKTFILVRWLEDETVGVMPIGAVHAINHQEIKAGVEAKVKWGRKLFTAEILQISSNNKLFFSHHHCLKRISLQVKLVLESNNFII